MMNCANKSGKTKRRCFTKEEDALMMELIKRFGYDWKKIASIMIDRTEKQCRERFKAYLKPDINNKPWTEEEDAKLVSLYSTIGPKWVEISKYFRGRTDNMVKNRFNFHIIKRPRNSKIDQNYIDEKLFEVTNKSDILFTNDIDFIIEDHDPDFIFDPVLSDFNSYNDAANDFMTF